MNHGSHRGPHPEDGPLFAPSAWPALREAVADQSWLLGRGYTAKSALKLVGDRHALTERQRMAVLRSACSDADLARRQRHLLPLSAARDARLLVDGFNLLTSLEVALSGGVVLLGRDGCARDIAGIHGSYRKVDETAPALSLVGEVLEAEALGECCFYLDSPVSNSGRLKQVILEVAARRGWRWSVEVVPDPDKVLSVSPDLIATADGIILDRCQAWINLARTVIEARVPGAWIVDLAQPQGPPKGA